MTLKQCTRAELIFIINRLCSMNRSAYDLEIALNDLAYEKEKARIAEAEKYCKIADAKRREYIAILSPYDGKRILDIPLEVLEKADKARLQAQEADRKWAKLMGIDLCEGKKGGAANAD